MESSLKIDSDNVETIEKEVETILKVEKWDDLNLRDNLLRGIYGYGFDTPSQIQKEAIPSLINKCDLLAQAQSGMGKTGTFTIGILQNIDLISDTTQAIVLAHTHELAKQISSVIQSIGMYMTGLRIKTLIGKTNVQDDISDLRCEIPHIVIGCAGRVVDMIQRRALVTSSIRVFCLDEADEMLTGFKDQIYNIFQHLNNDVQVILFSATMPEDVIKLTENFMRHPTMIRIKTEELNLECIQQSYIAVQDDGDKYDTLKNLFSTITISQCIIYANSVGRVMHLYKSLKEDGFSVGCIHSNMNTSEREDIMKEFRTGTCRFLICSNLTARGIDVQQVSTVINFDIPNCVDTYLHRIGRSGRWGRKGMAINLITRRDIHMLREIEAHYHSNIVEFTSIVN